MYMYAYMIGGTAHTSTIYLTFWPGVMLNLTCFLFTTIGVQYWDVSVCVCVGGGGGGGVR